MKQVSKQILQQLSRHKPFSLFLLTTLLFFIYKGIQYAGVGSYIPLLFILSILGLMIFCLDRSHRACSLFVGIWSWLVIIWSVIRLLLGVVDRFIKPIPEAHIHEQFGLYGSMLSVGFLIAGIYLWRQRKTVLE